jgi:thiol-disulfide isomerase/thioredoxin
MMKMRTFFTLLLSLTTFAATLAQSTAMDFQQADCAGNEHHLFAELEAGKVIVLDFVMLNCVPCIVGTTALETLVKPYENSHPGRVEIYSFGFLNSYTCEQLNAWMADNSFVHPVFSQGEAQTNYYGGMGMPTIVVVGSDQHKVYYNGKGYTSSMGPLITAAIDSALLYNPTGVPEKISAGSFEVFPTPFNDRLTVTSKLDLPGTEVIVSDICGQQLIMQPIPASGSVTLSTGSLPAGVYFAYLKSGGVVSQARKIIKN